MKSIFLTLLVLGQTSWAIPPDVKFESLQKSSSGEYTLTFSRGLWNEPGREQVVLTDNDGMATLMSLQTFVLEQVDKKPPTDLERDFMPSAAVRQIYLAALKKLENYYRKAPAFAERAEEVAFLYRKMSAVKSMYFTYSDLDEIGKLLEKYGKDHVYTASYTSKGSTKTFDDVRFVGGGQDLFLSGSFTGRAPQFAVIMKGQSRSRAFFGADLEAIAKQFKAGDHDLRSHIKTPAKTTH